MSFPDTLTLADGTPADHAFTKTSDDSSTTIYTDDASVIGLPTTLTVMHKIAKPGVDGVDKHTVKFTQIKADAQGKLFYLPITVSINKPRTVISEEDAAVGVEILTAFFTRARLTHLLRGEN
jgi:hypothetical protein